MGVSMQGGSTGHGSATAGDRINASPVSYGGGVMIGDIGTGSTMQNPTTQIGGSTSSADFGLKIPKMGGEGGDKGGEAAPAGILMQLHMYGAPQTNQVLLI